MDNSAKTIGNAIDIFILKVGIIPTFRMKMSLVRARTSDKGR